MNLYEELSAIVDALNQAQKEREVHRVSKVVGRDFLTLDLGRGFDRAKRKLASIESQNRGPPAPMKVV